MPLQFSKLMLSDDVVVGIELGFRLEMKIEEVGYDGRRQVGVVVARFHRHRRRVARITFPAPVMLPDLLQIESIHKFSSQHTPDQALEYRVDV